MPEQRQPVDVLKTDIPNLHRQVRDLRGLALGPLGVGRHSQKYVSAVDFTKTPFLVTLNDGTVAKCALPTYYPVVGDLVDAVWLDVAQAWVAMPLTGAGRATSRMWRAGAVSANPGWNAVLMDSIDQGDDPLGIGSLTQGGFVAVAAGKYKVHARASNGGATARMLVAVLVNGAENRRGYDATCAGPQGGSVGPVTLRLAVGDVVQLGVYSGTTVGLETGVGIMYLEITWSP